MTDIRAAAAIAQIGRTGVGGNRPPISEILDDLYTGTLVAEMNALAERANAMKRTVDSDADLDMVGPLVRDADALSKRIEKIREEEKAPHWQACKDVDGWFRPYRERAEKIRDAFQAAANQFTRRKAEEERRRCEEEARKRREAEAAKREATKAKREAEANQLEADASYHEAMAAAPASMLVEKTITTSGVEVKAETHWNMEIEDFDAIPLDRLRPYFKRDEVEKAIRMAIRQGVRSLPGVRIFEDLRARFR